MIIQRKRKRAEARGDYIMAIIRLFDELGNEATTFELFIASFVEEDNIDSERHADKLWDWSRGYISDAEFPKADYYRNLMKERKLLKERV